MNTDTLQDKTECLPKDSKLLSVIVFSSDKLVILMPETDDNASRVRASTIRDVAKQKRVWLGRRRGLKRHFKEGALKPHPPEQGPNFTLKNATVMPTAKQCLEQNGFGVPIVSRANHDEGSSISHGT